MLPGQPREGGRASPASQLAARPRGDQTDSLPLTSWKAHGWEGCDSVWASKLSGNGHRSRVMASGPLASRGRSRPVVTVRIMVLPFVGYVLSIYIYCSINLITTSWSRDHYSHLIYRKTKV